jgi:hypothetical protein
MSKKQIEHNENYHYTKHIDDDEGDCKSDDSTDCSSDDSIPEIWRELNDMRDQLRGFDIEIVKNYIDTELADDVEKIREEFHKQFDDVDNNDDLKLEVMILLGELGIQINKPKEKLILDFPN